MSKDFRETLYTVDEHGNRRWVYSAIEKGKYFIRRRVVAYGLMLFYLVLPWITVGGKQAVFLDFAERRFVFFGGEFWATDTQFLFLIFGTLAFSLFFFTALLGRVWCGWACPETVFLEFLFRPIERWIEGSPAQRARLDQAPWTMEKVRKKLLKHSLCAFFAWVIASSTLAYFIGREPLIQMMLDWPWNNPWPFIMTLAMMGLMAFQFGWFREQFCTVLCPYARFQSVLMDSNSLIVGYDITRGEPRGKRKKGAETESLGDCVDCGYCVRVCPTGIDIRNGLQLECVACTACVDACDSIMKKVGSPTGLIRYDTEDVLLGRSKTRHLLRARPVIYGLLLSIFAGTFVYALSTRSLSEAQIVRGASVEPYNAIDEHTVSNHLLANVTNKADSKATYTFRIIDNRQFELVTPMVPFPVEPHSVRSTPIFINFPKSKLSGGRTTVEVLIEGSDGYRATQTVSLVGPGAS